MGAPQKSKEAKAKAASGDGKKSKKKWSKRKSRDKLQNMCLFDKPTYDKVLKEVPNYKVITPSIVSDRMKIRGSLARRAIKELHGMGKIKLLVQHLPKWSTPEPSLSMTKKKRSLRPKRRERNKSFAHCTDTIHFPSVHSSIAIWSDGLRFSLRSHD